MKALKIIETLKDDYYDCFERGLAEYNSWKECDEAIEEIKTLEKQLEEYDSIVVGLNYKLAKAQSYIKYLEEQLGNSEDTVRAILEEGE